MGSLYKQKGSARWWVKYRDHNGVLRRESTETDDKALARQRLRVVEGKAAAGEAADLRPGKVLVRELLADLATHYDVAKLASARRVEQVSRLHLGPAFGARRAATITTAELNGYVLARRAEAHRQGEAAADASIRYELAILKRAFNLARSVTPPKVAAVPKFPAITLDNVRKGFLEEAQFRAILAQLPADLHPLVTVAYITGWRVQSELLTRQWAHVDFKAGELRIDPGETKNGEGRTFPFTARLRASLEAARAATGRLAIIPPCPWVFHRAGDPIKSFYGTWYTACDRAGLPRFLPHDFRRTAVRNLERAGVSRSAAMKMTGHLTESVYRRYAIVDDVMIHEGGAKLDRYHNAL